MVTGVESVKMFVATEGTTLEDIKKNGTRAQVEAFELFNFDKSEGSEACLTGYEVTVLNNTTVTKGNENSITLKDKNDGSEFTVNYGNSKNTFYKAAKDGNFTYDGDYVGLKMSDGRSFASSGMFNGSKVVLNLGNNTVTVNGGSVGDVSVSNMNAKFANTDAKSISADGKNNTLVLDNVVNNVPVYKDGQYAYVTKKTEVWTEGMQVTEKYSK